MKKEVKKSNERDSVKGTKDDIIDFKATKTEDEAVIVKPFTDYEVLKTSVDRIIMTAIKNAKSDYCILPIVDQEDKKYINEHLSKLLSMTIKDERIISICYNQEQNCFEIEFNTEFCVKCYAKTSYSEKEKYIIITGFLEYIEAIHKAIPSELLHYDSNSLIHQYFYSTILLREDIFVNELDTLNYLKEILISTKFIDSYINEDDYKVYIDKSNIEALLALIKQETEKQKEKYHEKLREEFNKPEKFNSLCFYKNKGGII